MRRLALLLAAASGCRAGATTSTEHVPPVVVAGESARSNIRRADYVGPNACGECHAKQFRQWRESPHASMNQRVEDARIAGDFAGARVHYAGGIATFGPGPVIALGARRFQVTRTIGTKWLQEYVGVEMGGDGTELRLPFGWWRRRGEWLHQQYYDSWFGPELHADGSPAVDAYDPDPSPWAGRCPWCHNTYAFELRARRAGVGQGLEQYFEPLEGGAAEGGVLPVDQLVTVGISCESCHLGGRDHAVDGESLSFVPEGPLLSRKPDAPDLAGGRKNPVVVDTICAQCHSTPTPRWPNGASVRNSSEALDMAGGACMSKIACTDCHDPHPGGVKDAMAACVGCHDHLAAPDVARAHARHDPAAVSCLDCHMPRVVQGLSAHTRTHHIGSPDAGVANACNLCHLERSTAWTARELEAGWGRRVAAGDDRPAGEAWLASPDAATSLVAASAWARSRSGRKALPRLLALLDDPVAHTRMWTLFAIEDLLGRRLTRAEYDPTAAKEVRAKQARRLRRP